MNGSKDMNGTHVSCVEPNCELLRILFYQKMSVTGLTQLHPVGKKHWN